MNVGDIVKLKSGSPEMTINRFTPFLGYAECAWYNIDKTGGTDYFNEYGWFKSRTFNPKALDLVKANNDKAN